MINESINATFEIASTKLDFQTWTAVSQNTTFLLVTLGIWLFPLIIALILGACIGGGSGASKKKMIQFGNFWLLWFLWFFLQGALFLIQIFPIFLEWGG